MPQPLPDHIYSVMIALAETSLILPNSAVVEVLGQDALIAPGSDAPIWLQGYVELQMQDIPVVSLEGMMGQAVPLLERKCRIVALNAPSQGAAFAVVSRSYPLIVTLNEVALKPVLQDDDPAAKLIYSRVQVANRNAIIPDLDAIASITRKHELA